MLVFNERRTVNMLKYSDLTKQFNEYSEAKSKYWERLQKAAFQLLKDLEDSLELASATWVDHDGAIKRYVDIGSTESGEFKRVHPMTFQGDDLQYSFALKITLEEGANVLPKSSYIQHISLKGSESGIAVTLQGTDRVIMSAQNEASDGQFASVVEAIKLRLIGALTVREFA